MHEEKKEPKKKGRKGDPFSLIAVLVALALAVALIILVMQYYQLTNSLTNSLANRQPNAEMTETKETGEEPETETALQERGTDQEEKTDTEASLDEPASELEETSQTRPETEALNDHPEPAPKERTGNDHPEPAPVTVSFGDHPEPAPESEKATQTESESETAAPSGAAAMPSTPAPAAQPAYQATDLTIADIPNSLYEQFQDPEELRSALFDWLTQNGFTEALDCTCSYEYEEDGDLLSFTLQFSGFAVEATYSTSSNQYSFLLL